MDRFGRLDVLVNNAGITLDGLLLRYKEEDWQRTLEVNLGGAFRCSRVAARPMVRKRYGRIVNLSSVVATMGNAGQVAYAATKAGLEGMTKALARELASREVTVNAVAPGYVDTDMVRAVPENVLEKIVASIPVGRLGRADDIARTVKFLVADDADFITGSTISVNGGHHMY